MADNKDMNNSVMGGLDSVTTFNYSPESLDNTQTKIEYVLQNVTENIGYYKKAHQLKKAIDGKAMWTVGQGWTTQLTADTVTLEKITGWGEDTFDSIMWNMVVMKHVCGDSFAEIIRNDKKALVNIKPLSPERVKIVLSKQGIIEGYKVYQGKDKWESFKPSEILHLCQDRVGDEMHGTSVIDVCKWTVDARQEAAEDWRKIIHRASVRVIYANTEDPGTLNKLKTQWKDGIENKDVIILPGKAGDDLDVVQYNVPPIDAYLRWIQYLDAIFYEAVGFPKILTGGGSEYTEASSKTILFTFDQTWAWEQRQLERDIWNQLAIKINYTQPQSIAGNVQEDEAKNTGQTSIQPNETKLGIGRTE